ncbi:MAG: sulfotransferase [Dokdonella sp.]
MLAANDPKRVAGLSPAVVRMLAAAANAISTSKLAEADAAFVGVLALAPAHPEVLRLLGVLRHLQQRPVEAVEILRGAAEARPGDALIHNNLGSVLRASGEIDAAIGEFRRACELAPEFDGVWFNLGKCLKNQSRMDEAHHALVQCIRRNPGHGAARIALAETLKSIGSIDEARDMYVSAANLPLHATRAWYGLANLKIVSFSPDDIRAMEQASVSATNDGQRIELGFALAKAYEDNGDFAKSFEVLSLANRRKRSVVTWASQAFHQLTNELLAADATTSSSAEPELGGEIIFVMSLPRSGSTLTEQILAAHPRVAGAGELSHLPDILTEESMRRGQPLPQWMPGADASDWQRLGEQYLERSARWRTDKPLSTDKGLNNWFHATAARRMLPSAKIVFCRRDPLETVFSCYRQMFSIGQEFSYALDDLVSYWKDFDRHASAMLDRHAGACIELVYEDLIADSESEIPRLLSACGLEFDQRCLRSHESDRHVRTASAAQVRQPIRGDTARAPVYGELLNPIRAALAARV